MLDKITREIVIGDDTMTIRPFTLNEYKGILKSKAEKTLETYLLNLIKRCVKTTTLDLNNLPKALGELILLHIWVLSMNPYDNIELQLPVTCDDCGSILDSTVNLNQSYVHQEDVEKPIDDSYDVIFKVSEETSLLLRKPRLFQDTDKIDMVIESITGVLIHEKNGGHTIIKSNEMTDDDSNALLQLIDIDKIQKIITLIDSDKCVSLAMIKPGNICKCEIPCKMKPIIGIKDILKEIGG